MPGDIIILHKCTRKWLNAILFLRYIACDRCNYFSFWAIFCPFTPLTVPKVKKLKNLKKAPGDIIILHTCTKNYDRMMYGSWDMVHNRRTDRQTERWTDRWKKWHIEVGVPPKNRSNFSDKCLILHCLFKIKR